MTQAADGKVVVLMEEQDGHRRRRRRHKDSGRRRLSRSRSGNRSRSRSPFLREVVAGRADEFSGNFKAMLTPNPELRKKCIN